MGDITVNSVPLEEFLKQQQAAEIGDVRESETRVKLYRGRSSTVQRAGGRTSSGAVVYRAGQQETHVIIAGMVFPWEAKAPYVRSGMSVLGAIELNQESNEIKCHECGQWFARLGSHVRVHGVTAKEYKRNHGLRKSASISEPNFKEKVAKRLRSHIKPPTDEHRQLAYEQRAKCENPIFGRRLEMANLLGRCREQLTTKILALAESLGRTPSYRELVNAGLWINTIKLAFGMPLSKVFAEIGLVPNLSGCRVGNYRPGKRVHRIA